MLPTKSLQKCQSSDHVHLNMQMPYWLVLTVLILGFLLWCLLLAGTDGFDSWISTVVPFCFGACIHRISDHFVNNTALHKPTVEVLYSNLQVPCQQTALQNPISIEVMSFVMVLIGQC